MATVLTVRSSTGHSLFLLHGGLERHGKPGCSFLKTCSLERRTAGQPIAFILSHQLLPLGPRASSYSCLLPEPQFPHLRKGISSYFMS